VTADLGKLSAEDLAAWLSALREASRANPADVAARIFEVEAQRVELEIKNRELLRAQTALIESHARYRDLYDGAPVAYLTLGLEGEIQEANSRAAALIGVDRARLIGRPLFAYVSPRDRELLRTQLRRCLETRAQMNTQVRLSVRGRDEVVTHVVSVPSVNAAGELVGCRTTIADISLIKRGEARLALLARASLLLAAPLVDDVPCDEVLRLFVPAFADLAALDLLDARRHLRPMAAAAVTAALERRAVAATARLEWLEGGIPAALADGAPLFLPDCSPSTLAAHGLAHEPLLAACGATSAFLVAVRSRGADLGVLTLAVTDARRRFDPADRTVAHDLAARLALALDNARLYRDARAAIQAREDVLAFVAHDLRTPVHAVQLSLTGLLEAAPAQERRSGWYRLDRVRRVADQMNRMIDDLLDLSTVDAGRLTVETTDCPVTSLVHQARDALGPLAHDKGIRLEVELPSTGDEVRCDPDRVLQVFSNLIGNAIKFTPTGGCISVVARITPSEAVFSVVDTGDGVASADLARLFDRYWQANADVRKGRGLGLFIARKLIEAQGGRIWAESQPGRGTTLSFTLPRVAAMGHGSVSAATPGTRETPPPDGPAVTGLRLPSEPTASRS